MLIIEVKFDIFWGLKIISMGYLVCVSLLRRHHLMGHLPLRELERSLSRRRLFILYSPLIFSYQQVLSLPLRQSVLPH